MTSHSTVTDPIAKDTSPSDELIRVRRWGSNWLEMLPRPSEPLPSRIELTVGTSSGCDIRIDDSDQLVSGTHARLVFEGGDWKIFDNHSKNGLWIDGERCDWAAVRSGTEIGLGRKFILIAESARSIALRTFLARILGWTDDCTTSVDHALRSVLATRSRR